MRAEFELSQGFPSNYIMTAAWCSGPFLDWVRVGQKTVCSAEGPFLKLVTSGEDGDSVVRFYLYCYFSLSLTLTLSLLSLSLSSSLFQPGVDCFATA